MKKELLLRPKFPKHSGASASWFLKKALSEKTKQLIAIAAAQVTQCPYCIRGHTAQAMRKGASQQEIMEAIWVAAEMRAGAAYAHATIAMDEMDKIEGLNNK